MSGDELLKKELAEAGVSAKYIEAVAQGRIRTWEDLEATRNGQLLLMWGIDHVGVRQLREAQASRAARSVVPKSEPNSEPVSPIPERSEPSTGRLSQSRRIPITELGLTGSARKALIRAGVYTGEDLLGMSRSQLKSLPGAIARDIRELERVRSALRQEPVGRSTKAQAPLQPPLAVERPSIPALKCVAKEFKPTSLMDFVDFLFAVNPDPVFERAFLAFEALDRLDPASPEVVAVELGQVSSKGEAIQRRMSHWVRHQWDRQFLSEMWTVLLGVLQDLGGAATTSGLVQGLVHRYQSAGMNLERFVQVFYAHCPGVTCSELPEGDIWLMKGITLDLLSTLREESVIALEQSGGTALLDVLHERLRASHEARGFKISKLTLQAALATSDRFAVTDRGWIELLNRPASLSDRLIALLRRQAGSD